MSKLHYLVMAFSLSIPFPICSIARDEIPFVEDLAEARKSQTEPRYAVLIFGADWCDWCQRMAIDTLDDPAVVNLADRYVWVHVDIDKQPSVAAQYQVTGVPHVVVLDAQDHVLASQAGYMATQPFIEFLTRAQQAPPPPNDLQRAWQAWRAAGRENKPEALHNLVIQLATAPTVERKEILSDLANTQQPEKERLAEMLADERLAVRAAAGAILQKVARGGPEFHALAEATRRQEQQAEWQRFLANSQPPRPPAGQP